MAEDLYSETIRNLRNLLDSIGIPTTEPNFKETPERWIRYLKGYMQDYDPKVDLGTCFPVEPGFHSMIVQSDIPFEGVCAHHLVPFLGRAHLGYIPNERVVGLSKLTRLVYGMSHAKPSIQEEICDKIADAIMIHLAASGTIVVIQAEHGCMACRGVERAGIITSTASVRGVFRDVPHAREEFYQLIASRRDL